MRSTRTSNPSARDATKQMILKMSAFNLERAIRHYQTFQVFSAGYQFGDEQDPTLVIDDEMIEFAIRQLRVLSANESARRAEVADLRREHERSSAHYQNFGIYAPTIRLNPGSQGAGMSSANPVVSTVGRSVSMNDIDDLFSDELNAFSSMKI